MPLFDITFLRVDRDENPTAMEVLSRAVDWPVVPREGEGVSTDCAAVRRRAMERTTVRGVSRLG